MHVFDCKKSCDIVTLLIGLQFMQFRLLNGTKQPSPKDRRIKTSKLREARRYIYNLRLRFFKRTGRYVSYIVTFSKLKTAYRTTIHCFV
jgi:hypothetical protein